MKICFITTISATIDSFFMSLTEYIHDNTDWEISIICSDSDDFAEKLPQYVNYIPVTMKRGISFSGISDIFKLRRIFKKEKFDIIQYSTPNAAFLASIAAKLAKAPVRNYHLMGFRFLGSSGVMQKFLKIIEIITCKFSTHIECVSESNRQIGIDQKIFDADKAVVVWNGSTGGVDVSRFNYKKRTIYRNEIRRKYSLSEEEFVFGYVGRVVADKGVNEILQAFSKINNAKLFMIGRLEDTESLNQELYEKSINNESIIYTGSVDNVEMYFSAIDVLLLPSYREGFGNVIIEAAAMGTPSIISNIPGPIDAVIPGKTAKVVEVKNAEALYEAMLVMMNTDYVAMGIQAKDFVVNSFESNKLNEHIIQRKLSLVRK